MIDNRVEDMLKDFGYRLSAQGMSLEQYMQFTGTTVDTFKEQFKDQAAAQVKSNLVLDKIAQVENLTVSGEDLEEELKKMAEMYGMELDKVKTLIGENEQETMKDDLKVRKAVDFVTENAKAGKPAAKKAPAKKADDEKKAPAKKAPAKKAPAKKEADGEKKAPAKKTTAKKTTAKKEEKAE